MVDPTPVEPKSAGSGALIGNKDRLFCVSVQHVTDKPGRQAALVVGNADGHGTNLFSLPAFNYLDQFEFQGLSTNNPTLKANEPLEICYTEISGKFYPPVQKANDYGGVTVEAGYKQILETELDYEPTKDEGYSFLGRIRSEINGNVLQQNERLTLGMKYDCLDGVFEKFILPEVITDPADYKGTSGAPIFSETGEPVAFVTHGFKGQPYLYGFSARELKRYLDVYIDMNPLPTSNANNGR